MSDDSTVRGRLARGGIVAVLRAPDARHLVSVARTLCELGVTALEVTMTTAGAVDALATLAGEVPSDVVVGAGTVLTERDAAECIRAGAEFLVAPSLVPAVVRHGLAASVPVYPGALTPSEFQAACQLGVEIVKLFPAAVMGPGYLEDLRGPFPDLAVMPTGGIRLDSIAAWLDAGAVAVGLGGPLIGDALEGGSLDALRSRTEAAMDAVSRTRVVRQG